MKMLKKVFLGIFALTAVFAVTSCGGGKSAEERVSEAKDAIVLGASINGLKNDLELPKAAKNNTTLTWAVEEAGKDYMEITAPEDSTGYVAVVTRPEVGTENVTFKLTCTITYKKVSDTKDFNVTVVVLDPTEVAYNTVAELHEKAVSGDFVYMTGVISHIYESGFYLADGTNQINVFFGSGVNPSEEDSRSVIGKKVTVYGKYTGYNDSMQIDGSKNEGSIVVKYIEDTTVEVTKTVASVKEVQEIVCANDKTNGGKVFTVTGYVKDEKPGETDNTKTSNCVSIIYGAYVIPVYYRSLDSSYSALRALNGKKVTVDVILYHSWTGPTSNLVLVAGTPTEQTETAADKLAMASGTVSIAAKAFKDIALPTEATYGDLTATVTWATSDASVITTTGAVTATETEKTVTLTATFSATGVDSVVVKYEVAVAKVVYQTNFEEIVEETLALTKDDNYLGDEVNVKGLVVSVAKNGFFLFDGTRYIYIAKASNMALPAANTIVGVVGQEYSNYSNPQIKNVVYMETFTETYAGTQPSAAAKNIADIATTTAGHNDNVYTMVKLTGKLVKVISGTNTNLFLFDGDGNKINIYYSMTPSADFTALTALATDSVETATSVTIVGFVSTYNSSSAIGCVQLCYSAALTTAYGA